MFQHVILSSQKESLLKLLIFNYHKLRTPTFISSILGILKLLFVKIKFCIHQNLLKIFLHKISLFETLNWFIYFETKIKRVYSKFQCFLYGFKDLFLFFNLFFSLWSNCVYSCSCSSSIINTSIYCTEVILVNWVKFFNKKVNTICQKLAP